MTDPKRLVRRLVPRTVRNWLRSPTRTWSWMWDAARHAVGYDPVIEPRPGWRLRCHPAARRAFTPPLGDPSQIPELDGFIASCTARMILFDVGAHFGLFSLASLHFGGPEAQAVALEPSASAARMLHLEARLNRVSSRLRVVRAAAGERSGWQDMLPVGVIADGYYIQPGSGRLRGDLVRVRSVSVDDLATELRLVPTHLKIDVEGSELSVLRGAGRLLGGDRPPLVFLELHNAICRAAGTDPAACLSELASLGYGFYRHDGRPLDATAATSPSVMRLVARRAAI